MKANRLVLLLVAALCLCAEAAHAGGVIPAPGLNPQNNLSDLANTATARTNLGADAAGAAASVATAVTAETTRAKTQEGTKMSRLLCVAPSFQGTTAGLSNGTDTSTTYRYQITATQAVHDLQLLYGNFSVSSANVESGSGNTVTVTAGLEYNSQVLQVTFNNGATSGVLANNGSLLTDVIGVSIPAGATYYVRTCVTVTAGNKWCYSYPGTANDTLINGSDATLSTGALGSTGFNVGIVGPHAVLGYSYPLSPGALLFIGDSIAAGTGDTVDRDSFLVRAALGAGVPFNNTSTGGTSFVTWDSWANVTNRVKAYNYAQFAICELGTNDTHIQSFSSMQTHALSIWTQLANRGMPVYQTTLTPHVTTTDGCRTTANQTPLGIAISAATNASPIAITSATHYLTTGQTVNIVGCTGNTAANGTWVITVTSSTTLTLNGSTGNGTYTANSGTLENNETIRVAFNGWIRAGAPIDPVAKTPVAIGTAGALVAGQSGHPLAGYFEIANLVEANAANALTQNGGLWQVVGTSSVDSGTATSGNVLQLIDTAKSWTANAYAGLNCIITGGTGAGESAGIASNTATALSFLSSVTTAPDATSTFVIQNTPSFDGTHPSTNNHIRMAGGITTSLFAPF